MPATLGHIIPPQPVFTWAAAVKLRPEKQEILAIQEGTLDLVAAQQHPTKTRSSPQQRTVRPGVSSAEQRPLSQPVQLSPKVISRPRNSAPSREHKTCACLSVRKPAPRQRDNPSTLQGWLVSTCSLGALQKAPQSASNSPTHVLHPFAFFFPNTYARCTYCVHVLSWRLRQQGDKYRPSELKLHAWGT